MKRSEIVEQLKKSIIDNTNKYGYLDINTTIVSAILNDLEAILPISYEAEDPVPE